MIALLIILAILLAILLLKLGVDAVYDTEGFRLAIVIGPLHLKILPGSGKKSRTKKKAVKSKTNERKKRDKKPKENKKKSLDNKFLLEVVKLGLRALNRFRISLHVDVFRLRFVSASDDPYKTAMNCAYATTAVNMLAPLSRRAFRVTDSKVEIVTDFFEEKPSISGRLKLSIRVWRILQIALTFACAFIGVWLRHRKRTKAKTTAEEKSKEQIQTEKA